MEICTVGGYNEVGRNMTAVKFGDKAVIFDMGLHIEKVVNHEDEERYNLKSDQLLDIGAIPDYRTIDDWKENVVAIMIGHCHLDHIGAVVHIAGKYPNAPIIGTPYTIEILKSIIIDDKIKLPNKLVVLNADSSLELEKDLTVEFVNITHSTLQTVVIALHTSEGTVVYANDFKLDDHPTIGQKPNMKRLRQLGEKGVKVLILDSLNAGIFKKTPSEKVAKEMLKDVLLGTNNRGHAIIATTFSSHIARLKSIVELGMKMNRKVIFLGRSLHKYVTAAEKLKLVKISGQALVIGYSREVRQKLAQIAKEGRDKYLIVCTGNQGEPNSMLSRLAGQELPWKFQPDDHVVFSCRTIPSPSNQANRELLERRLRNQKVRIFSDIHVSGHASREDHRDFLDALKPEHIIPSHGDITKLSAMADLASELGYTLGKTVHLMQNGQRLTI